jgi:hypothetical protein
VVGFDDACVSVCAVPLDREENVDSPDSPLTTVSSVPAPSLWFDCELWVDCDNDEPQSEPEPFFFDAIATLDVTATTARPLLSCAPVRSFLVHWWFLFVFWLTAIFWDTLTYFVTAPYPPPPLRRYRRSSCSLTLSGYPATWLLLSAVMIHVSSCQGCPPSFPILPISHASSYACQEGTTTFCRICELDKMVFLQSDTLWQFNQLKFHGFLTQASTSSFCPRSPSPVSEPPILSTSELDQYFDALEVVPEPYTGGHFFNAETWSDDPRSPDWFPLQDLCLRHIMVDCCCNDDFYTTSPENGRSFQAQLNLTTLDTQANQLLHFGTVRHPVFLILVHRLASLSTKMILMDL